MQDCFWSFYNQRNQTRYDGFRTVQARAFVHSLLPDQIADWIVWKEATPEWMPLANYPELLSEHSDLTFANTSEFAIDPNSKTVPKTSDGEAQMRPNTITGSKPFEVQNLEENIGFDQKLAETSTELLGGMVPEDIYLDLEEIDTADLKLEGSAGPKPELRRGGRYRMSVDAEVDYGGPSRIKTKTLDMSMGGLLLAQVVPEAAKRNVKIFLARGAERIETMCQNIPDRNGKPTRRFRFVDINRIDILRNWLIQK